MDIEINAKSHLFISPKINFIFSQVSLKYCYPKRAGLSRNQVSTVDIQIKRSGLRVSNSKVFAYFCVKSKLEELRGHKEIPALSNAFYL